MATEDDGTGGGIRRTGSRSRPEVLDLFVERLEDYKASVVRVGAARASDLPPGGSPPAGPSRIAERAAAEPAQTVSRAVDEGLSRAVAEGLSRAINETLSLAVAEDLPRAVAHALSRRGITSLAVPHDLPEEWLADVAGVSPATGVPPGSGVSPGSAVSPVAAASVEILRDGPDHPIPHDRLAGVQGALTGCALAIAETGTIVLDSGPAQGRRALTLLPDYHLCVVFARQVVELVPEGVEAMGRTVRERRAPLTLISGPSATSDIELSRVEGVHGPRTLEVILVEEGEAAP